MSPGPTDPDSVRIERTYQAPVTDVFDAWTSADLLRRWYPPGADWETPEAHVDLRVGGRLRVVMRSPGGEIFAGGGEYREIVRPTRLVFTWTWDRPDVATGPQLVEIDFIEHSDTTTTVIMVNHGLSDEPTRDSHRQGWEDSFDNLAEILGAA